MSLVAVALLADSVALAVEEEEAEAAVLLEEDDLAAWLGGVWPHRSPMFLVQASWSVALPVFCEMHVSNSWVQMKVGRVCE